MVTNHIFEDENNTEYLVTVFSGTTLHGSVKLAIRPLGASTWSPPVKLIRTEESR